MFCSAVLPGRAPSAAATSKWLIAFSRERWALRSSAGALVLVGIQQGRRRVTVQDERQLPAQVLRVVDRARQSQPAGGRVPVRGVAEQEHPAGPERRCHDGIDRPPGDLVDLHRDVRQAQRAPGVGLDLRVGLGARVIGRVVEVDHPFLRLRSPVLRSHRDQHRPGAGLRREDPPDQHVRVSAPTVTGPPRRAVSRSASPRRGPHT